MKCVKKLWLSLEGNQCLAPFFCSTGTQQQQQRQWPPPSARRKVIIKLASRFVDPLKQPLKNDGNIGDGYYSTHHKGGRMKNRQML